MGSGDITGLCLSSGHSQSFAGMLSGHLPDGFMAATPSTSSSVQPKCVVAKGSKSDDLYHDFQEENDLCSEGSQK